MRVFITQLAFNTEKMIEGALQNLDNTTTDHEHRRLVKTIFDPGYPGNLSENVKAIAARFGWWYCQIPNLGGMANHNTVIHDYCKMLPGDYYVTFDPDVRHQQVGWVSAMIEALESDDKAVFVCAARAFHDERWVHNQHGKTIQTLSSGLRVARYNSLIAWSTGMFKGGWLAARPKDFKAEVPHSYNEHADYALMQRHGKTWLSLVDFYDNHQSGEPLYVEWKAASGAKTTTQSFEDWLKGKR